MSTSVPLAATQIDEEEDVVSQDEKESQEAEPGTPRDDGEGDEEEEEEGDDCCVCMEKVSIPFETDCKHIFCFLCLKGFLMSARRSYNNPTCPLCRAHVDEKKLLGAQMHKDAWKNAQRSSSVAYQWQYQGRNGR